MNEPESNDKWTEPTKAYLKGAKAFIKEVDPNHLTTIGITFRTDRLREIGMQDVLQYHHYGTGKKSAHLGPDPVRKTINGQRMNQTERPLIIGEFGMCTARDPQYRTSPELAPKLNDQAGTEEEHAKVYAMVLEAAQQERIGGAIAGCLYDYRIKNPNESHFGLIRADGTLKPAAVVLQNAYSRWSHP